jgi:hypothetical protein
MDLVKLIVILLSAIAIILGLRSVTTSVTTHTTTKRKSKRRSTTRSQASTNNGTVEFDIAPNRKMMTYAIQLSFTVSQDELKHVYLETDGYQQDITIFFNNGQGNGLTRDVHIITAAVNKTLQVRVVTTSNEYTMNVC